MHTPRKVLVVGASDTVCAIIRAIDLNGQCDVLGAGYTHKEYMDTLVKHLDYGAAKRYNEKVCDIDIDIPGIFKVNAVYHSDVFPTSKYKTLYEESQFLYAATCGNIFDGHVFMFESTTEFSREVYESLRRFIALKGYTEIRVIDFGGEITCIHEELRGVATLGTLRKISSALRIPLFVEIYGLGCDGHKHVSEVEASMYDAFRNDLISFCCDCSTFVSLCNSLDGCASVMDRGRALRSFIDARCVQTREDFMTHCAQNIKRRTDLYTGHEDDFKDIARLMGMYVEVMCGDLRSLQAL